MAAPKFNDQIHSPVRLRICSTLAAVDAIDFTALRAGLDVTDSVLSKHLARLEAVGFVSITKKTAPGHLRTWVSLTPVGRQVLAGHLAALREIAAQSGM
ncbi:MAG: transcriptional regulator [Bifidobacteriaceae bacterium]|jgi:DNA-binding MarR family transcriptional regulator|nr:transcriptional regulator [Bifidobacteriaceae bacterium]